MAAAAADLIIVYADGQPFPFPPDAPFAEVRRRICDRLSSSSFSLSLEPPEPEFLPAVIPGWCDPL